MKETIRVKLTKDAEKALASLVKLKETKKDVIDWVVECDCDHLLSRFSLPNVSGGGEPALDTRRIATLKKEFKAKSGEINTYAISSDAKATLSAVSKTLKINMGLTLSVLLEDMINALTKVLDRQLEEDKILKELAALKESISSEVSAMNDLWYKLRDLYPDDEENSPFYLELMYFFDGFYELNP